MDIQPVETMPSEQILGFLDQANRLKMVVHFSDGSGRALAFRCQTFVSDWKAETIDVTSLDGSARQYLTLPAQMRWKLEGFATAGAVVAGASAKNECRICGAREPLG